MQARVADEPAEGKDWGDARQADDAQPADTLWGHEDVEEGSPRHDEVTGRARRRRRWERARRETGKGGPEDEAGVGIILEDTNSSTPPSLCVHTELNAPSPPHASAM